jgi:hypothetical protein
LTRAQVLHAIDGRLRIRVSDLKHNSGRADSLSKIVRMLPGVRSVAVNVLTGTATVTYDRAVIAPSNAHAEIGRVLECEIEPVAFSMPGTIPLSHAGRHVADFVLKAAIEAALKRAIHALI